MNDLSKIGLFYGSSTCYTEIVAEKIQRHFESGRVDVFNIADTPISSINDYHFLIFGIPTWDYGELQEDWESRWEELQTLDFTGKTVALFGLGDQIGYPDWFLDAMGYLHDIVVLQGATIIGHWPNKGYEFNASKALTAEEDYFVGLAIDEENEFEATNTRIKTWCDGLREYDKNHSL